MSTPGEVEADAPDVAKWRVAQVSLRNPLGDTLLTTDTTRGEAPAAAESALELIAEIIDPANRNWEPKAVHAAAEALSDSLREAASLLGDLALRLASFTYSVSGDAAGGKK